MTDSLGDRIKRYERAYNQTLTPRTPVIVRVDGRAFHTYTKGMDRPFDYDLMCAMEWAASHTANEMQGFKLAYVQSDEATFLITDDDQLDTQGWFAYELNKVVSLSAAIFTAHFNNFMHFWNITSKLATFDARAFNVPAADVPNVFIWRQRDWERNSLQMLARAHFSHSELHGKGRRDMHDMLHAKGINWASLKPREKNGTFITKDHYFYERADYERIQGWINDAYLDGDEGLQRVG